MTMTLTCLWYSTFVLRYCWLANTTGKHDAFLAFDMLQEHNIRDIKVSLHTTLRVQPDRTETQVIFMVLGPFATWEYVKKISASIPFQRQLKDHVEAQFNHFRRGKSHTNPDKEGDIQRLQDSYHAAGCHSYKPGRKLADVDRAEDYLAIGSDPVKLTATIKRWVENRVSERSTQEIHEVRDEQQPSRSTNQARR